MYSIIKFFLFLQSPEKVHYQVMNLLKFAYNNKSLRKYLTKKFAPTNPDLEREVFGLKFKNPIGLAAGFDKNGVYTDELAMLGFGFIEIGTVTPKAQPGNDKPRLFRLPKDKALINRMGFNNEGAAAAAKALKARNNQLIIGGNIGKNKVTPNEEADLDYIQCFNDLYDSVDYFTVNVSSPNTPNLRALQEKEPLKKLLSVLKSLNEKMGAPKPLLLKIAPDLTKEQLDDIIEIVLETKIDGVVATNTTISRNGLVTTSDEIENIGAGGLSGKPVTQMATEVIKYLHVKSKGAFPIIAVGGIFTAADAQEKLDAGASLVQIYTGFIYEGPAIVKNICDGLR